VTPYPATSYALLNVANPNVLAWAVKPAEEGIGSGVIVRLWNLSKARESAEITLQPTIATAAHVTHIETEIEPADVSTNGTLNAKFETQQLQSYRLQLRPSRASEK